jgi:hypothetical protein
MGNRAVITFHNNYHAPCVYLHWNGGRASVEGFLRAARELGFDLGKFRSESSFMDAFARMIASRFFSCNVGRNVYREQYGRADTDNYDNGVYIIDEDLRVIGRLHNRGQEEINPAKTAEIAAAIVNWQKEVAA